MDDLITHDGQMQWAGLLLGETTPYVGVQLTGWDDLPDLESGTATMPTRHGAWPGQLLAGPRTLTWDFRLLPRWREDFPVLLDRLRRATGIRQDEQPLVIQLAGARRVLWGRVIKRAITADRVYTRGEPTGTLVWECSDPRRYEVPQRAAHTGLPDPESGLGWPLTWPPDWHDSDPGEAPPHVRRWDSPGHGRLAVENTGDAETFPVIEFRGCVKRPRLTDVATGRFLEYGVALGPYDVLTVDTAAGTVLLNGTDSLLDTAANGSVPEAAFTLEPGLTRLLFTAEPGTYDPQASASVFWRSAHW